MLIEKGSLSRDTLAGKVVIVTGAGRGIGFEAAKTLDWLGANVVIAEIDEENGKKAQETINREFGAEKTVFVKTDVSNQKDIDQLSDEVISKFVLC